MVYFGDKGRYQGNPMITIRLPEPVFCLIDLQAAPITQGITGGRAEVVRQALLRFINWNPVNCYIAKKMLTLDRIHAHFEWYQAVWDEAGDGEAYREYDLTAAEDA